MPDEVAARRFDRVELASDTTPYDMLNKVLGDIAGGDQFDHVTVLAAKRGEDGSIFFRRYHAGDFNFVERIGMIENYKLDEWDVS